MPAWWFAERPIGARLHYAVGQRFGPELASIRSGSHRSRSNRLLARLGTESCAVGTRSELRVPRTHASTRLELAAVRRLAPQHQGCCPASFVTLAQQQFGAQQIYQETSVLRLLRLLLALANSRPGKKRSRRGLSSERGNLRIMLEPEVPEQDPRGVRSGNKHAVVYVCCIDSAPSRRRHSHRSVGWGRGNFGLTGELIGAGLSPRRSPPATPAGNPRACLRSACGHFPFFMEENRSHRDADEDAAPRSSQIDATFRSGSIPNFGAPARMA
jgi:hypothetical protein